MSADINLQSEVEGYYTIELFKVDDSGREVTGSRRQPIPTFKNLITNAGLDRMGSTSGYIGYCQVGSGSTPATVNDVSLASRVAGVSTIVSNNTGAMPSAPYYAFSTRTFQFPAGVATGNISEVGVGWALTDALFSRALIVDGAGTPTTITVLSDEILQVTYQLRYYAPTADVTGTLTLNGVSTSWISRASGVNAWGSIGDISEGLYSFDLNEQRAHDGAINASVVGTPAGSRSPRSSISDDAYSAGSYTRTGSVTWDIERANFAGGIQSVFIRKGIGSYQIGFTPPIMKTSAQTLTLKFSHSWARRSV